MKEIKPRDCFVFLLCNLNYINKLGYVLLLIFFANSNSVIGAIIFQNVCVNEIFQACKKTENSIKIVLTLITCK